MKKLKLSLKIVAALFIFAVIGLVACNKSSLGFDENENVYSEDAQTSSVVQDNVSINDVIKMLYDQDRIISVKENYTDENTGATGTLYTYKSSDGTKQILKVSEKPKNIEEKGWIIHSVATWGAYDINGNFYLRTECNGPNGGCAGWANFYIAWN